MSRMRRYFNQDIGGQSMRAGGATSFIENSVPPSLRVIQFIGRCHWHRLVVSSSFGTYLALSGSHELATRSSAQLPKL